MATPEPGAEVRATAAPRMTEMKITVMRCKCGDPASHKPNPCPQGIADHSATRILRKYSNPLRQLAWNLFRR